MMDLNRRDAPRRSALWKKQALGLAAIAALIGCTQSADKPAPAQTRRPQQAGQAVDPRTTVAHLAATEAAAIRGDQQAAAQHVQAVTNDIMRAARMPDPSRRIDHEAARAAVRPLPGVRTAIWMDDANLIVMVDGQAQRSMAMIDQVCLALEPLGDTLAVVVNLQDVTAKTHDDAATLSRNCQLPEGQRAFAQGKRQVDVVSPELREAFKKQQEAGK